MLKDAEEAEAGVERRPVHPVHGHRGGQRHHEPRLWAHQVLPLARRQHPRSGYGRKSRELPFHLLIRDRA